MKMSAEERELRAQSAAAKKNKALLLKNMFATTPDRISLSQSSCESTGSRSSGGKKKKKSKKKASPSSSVASVKSQVSEAPVDIFSML